MEYWNDGQENPEKLSNGMVTHRNNKRMDFWRINKEPELGRTKSGAHE